MQGYIKRNMEGPLLSDLKDYPAIAILGPRQCGKSTLAINLESKIKNFLYLDLEKASDLKKLSDPEIFFKANSDRVICLDEIQKKPEIFTPLRSILDENKRNGQVIILGSASRDLIKQSSESLAGRISYLELTPFTLPEIKSRKNYKLTSHWLRGGFPRSYLSDNDEKSMRWRTNFIKTFLERDIPQLGFNIPSGSISRLWQMCAHSHGQILNSSRLGESLGVTYHTVRNYIDILEQTFMLRVLSPLEANLKKRLVKSPKIYIRDSGILHALLEITTFNDLLGHPVYGASWEGYALECILSQFPNWRRSFYRTSAGAEIDLVLERGRQRVAVEFKASTAPEPSKGFWQALEDLKIGRAWIIAPVDESYDIRKNVTVSPLDVFLAKFGD